MQRNFKLTHHVTAALSLIAFGFHPSTYALGLGDLDVKSNLGQPLKATMNVLGASDLKGTSCLSLGPNSDLNHVNFMLGPLIGDIAKITVTSNHNIDEPIVNLTIIAGCDISVRRDYILLLDPPFYGQVEPTLINNIEDTAIVQKADTNVNVSTELLTPTVQKLSAENSKTSNIRNKKTSSSPKKTKVVPQNSTGISEVAIKNADKIKPETAKLSISGGTYVTNSQENNIYLRLDKQLSFTPDASITMTNEAIAIEDEVTVMNKRLAHLQQQFTSLQKQNLTLVSENKIKSEQISQMNTFHFSNLLPFLGSGLLLISGYTAFHWFRRRQKLLQTHHTEAIWTNTNGEHETSLDDDSSPLVSKESFANFSFGIQSSAEDEQLFPRSMENTFESTKNEEQQIFIEDDENFSVLDHADIFLSHGRSTLAIQLLQNHLIDHPKQSVTIWLFLLDLLAKENLESLYQQTVQDCQLYFNIKIASFSKPEIIANESLEDFPHLAQGLEHVWNTPAAVVFLDDLIYNNRLEPRAGLAKNLIEELVLLRSMSQENINSAEVIHLDQKKTAIFEQKEALLEKRKADKLQELVDAEKASREKIKAEKNETDFEFTLVEKY